MKKTSLLQSTVDSETLFIQSENNAKLFSLLEGCNNISFADDLSGLIDNITVEKRLNEIKQLAVDEYIDEVVMPTQQAKRLGAKVIIASLNAQILNAKELGPFYSAELCLKFKDTVRRIGIIAQERGASNGVWLPEHHKLAADTIHSYVQMRLPIVYLIDTPGADAGEQANSHNQAHSISKLIAQSCHADVPTVGIVIGVGYSGGAIPFASANILLSVRDGIFNTIQPQGLQSIARKFNLSWQECARGVGVSPEELCALGCIDGIVDYSPLVDEGKQSNLQKAIVSSIEAIESSVVAWTLSSSENSSSYFRNLRNSQMPDLFQRKLKVRWTGLFADSPTSCSNIFGEGYRYLRYLTLRKRIHSISINDREEAKDVQFQGDLAERLLEDKERIFDRWLEAPDKLIYEERLVKAWKKYRSKYTEIHVKRNSLSQLLLGKPDDNLNKAIRELSFEVVFSLYNRWKSSAVYNFSALIQLLEDDERCPTTKLWPEINEVTIFDVAKHENLRKPFLAQCRNMLIFDALYDQVIENLSSVAKEAMENQKLLKKSVEKLIFNSLDAVINMDSLQDSFCNESTESNKKQTEANFKRWVLYFFRQKHFGDFLIKVELWKSIGYPQMNDSLFVIVTYYFEHLLPEYVNSLSDGTYKGIIAPSRIGRKKDFWNRLTIGYKDLLIQQLLNSKKGTRLNSPDNFIKTLCKEFTEMDIGLTSSDPVQFPGFSQAISRATKNDIRSCGLVTGIGILASSGQHVAMAISNVSFQAGAFDMASAEKFCRLLIKAAEQGLPVVCLISSGGMQTKEGASSLFSMAVVNDRLTHFIQCFELPVLMIGFGDCTGGAQASFVTHPLVHTYYFSGANMPFAGQMVVPAYLPPTATLSNYLSVVPGAMDGLVKNLYLPELDEALREIDPKIPLPKITVEDVIARVLSDNITEQSTCDGVSQLDVMPKSLMKNINSVLIHARGCTAVKLIRKAQENNIKVVLVASDPDMASVPALMLKSSDKLVCLGGNTSDESYLNASSILKVAEYEKVDALHPGIGFLSETPEFARLCVNQGVNFIGPSANSMMTMGNKANAIETVQNCNVPVVPGSHGILLNVDEAVEVAEKIGYPALLKAVHGGGGKGIQVVRSAKDMYHYYNQVSAEARSAFGNGDLYLEKFVTSMRHIEVQLLRDGNGNGQVLGLRDCSVQRNNQKVVEESFSTMLPEKLKQQVFDYTLAISEAVDYTGAGTVEFIYDLESDEVYFMEMNTRLQVEHPVTEATSGIDIVKTQFSIASGHSIDKLEPQDDGYALEVRVTAEKVTVDGEGILQLEPSPGVITKCIMPTRDDIELISIAATGIEISPFYDSLIAQIICRGSDRGDVIRKMNLYLDSVVIEGIPTNISLLKRILQDPIFNDGRYDTNYLPKLMATINAKELIAEIQSKANSSQEVNLSAIKVDDSDELKVLADSSGIFYTALSPSDPDFVKQGDIVTNSQILCLMEAMKMFRQLSLDTFSAGKGLYPADKCYRIERINNINGQQVSKGDLLFIVSIMDDK